MHSPLFPKSNFGMNHLHSYLQWYHLRAISRGTPPGEFVYQTLILRAGAASPHTFLTPSSPRTNQNTPSSRIFFQSTPSSI